MLYFFLWAREHWGMGTGPLTGGRSTGWCPEAWAPGLRRLVLPALSLAPRESCHPSRTSGCRWLMDWEGRWKGGLGGVERGSRVESPVVGPQSRAKEGGRNPLRSCSKYAFTAGPWPLALPPALPFWVDSGWPGFPLCVRKGRAGSRSHRALEKGLGAGPAPHGLAPRVQGRPGTQRALYRL